MKKFERVAGRLAGAISGGWFRPFIAVAALTALLLLAALLIPPLVDLESSRGAIVAQIEKQLDRRVSLGTLSLRLLPRIEVRATEVRIADDPGFGSGDFVMTRAVRLRVGLWSLLRGRPELRGVELDSPQIVLIRRPDGAAPVWNWSSLRPLREPGRKEDSGPLDLVVRNGRFTLIDRLVDPPIESTWSGIDISLDKFAASQQFSAKLAVIMPEQDGQPGGVLELKGRLGPLVKGDPLATPVDARIVLNGVGIAALESLAGVGRSGRNGRLTLEMELSGSLTSQLKARGTARGENLRLVADPQVAAARTPVELKFDVGAVMGPESRQIDLQIGQGELILGETRLEMNGKIGLPAEPTAAPVVDLTLNGEGINLASLLESAYAFGFGPPPGTKAAGQADLALRIRNASANPAGESVVRPSLEGLVSLRGLRFEGGGLPQAIEVSDLKMEATPESLKFSPFRTALGNSSVLQVERLELKNYRVDPVVEMESATSNARLEDLLRIAESFGLRPDLKGTGLVTLRIGLTAPLTPTPVLSRLSGSGKISQASLETSSLTRPIAVPNVDLNFTGDSARLDNLSIRLASSSLAGSIRINNFTRPQVVFALQVDQLSIPEIRSLIRETPGRNGNGSLPTLTASGQLSIGQVRLDGLTADRFQSKIALRHGLVTLDPLSLDLYGGTWRGAVSLNQTDFSLKGQLSGVDVNQLLSNAARKSPLYGRLDGRVDLRGRNRGGDAGDLISNLIGTGEVTISEGRITSFDLLKQVETVGRLINLPAGGAATAFRQLRTSLRFDPGVMRTDGLQIVMTDLTASGEGLIRFGDPGGIDYAILARLSPALTRRILSNPAGHSSRSGDSATPPGEGMAPGSEPGERPSSKAGALSQIVGTFFTEKDALVIPLKIYGPLSAPRFVLDSETMRKRATSSILENLQQKILGPRRQNSPKSPDDAEQTSPRDTIKGILDRFKKKKPGAQP